MMTDGLILALIFLFGCFYSAVLGELEHHFQLVSRETYLVVVLGVGATVSLIGLFPLCDHGNLTYWKVPAAFSCVGGPMLTGSLINRFVQERQKRLEALRHAAP